MTLKEATKDKRIMRAVYNIGFNKGDETQFDVDNYNELNSLWEDFCKDEGCSTDSVDYVRYAGSRDSDVYEQLQLIRSDGYLDAAYYLEQYVSGKAELNYIKSFIQSEDYESDFWRKTLRCLWTAYCHHQNLEPDTMVYDKTLQSLWKVIKKDTTQDWSCFDSFDFYMGSYLA